jgi:DUF2075 family protein
MSKYIKTIREFLIDEKFEIIRQLKMIDDTVDSSQVKAWEVLIDDLKKSNLNQLNKDLYIAIEYSLPIDGMGIDVLIAGIDSNKNKKAYIIEVKQWVDSNIYEYNFGEYRNNSLTLHPQIQVSRHQTAFVDYLNIGEKYKVEPSVYMKNLSQGGIKKLIELNPLLNTSNILVFKELDEVIKAIGMDLIASEPSIFSDLLNAEYKPSKSIINAMNSIITKHDPFILTIEQEEVVNKVIESFENGKKIVRITGAAGSGKTAILLHLYINLLREESDEKRPIFISGAQNTKLYQSLFREVERSFSFSFSLNRMVGKTLGHKYYILMDEAQHNREGIISEMIDRKANLILCYDESQTINADNSLRELNSLEGREDFLSIELQNSVRFSGSQVFESNVKKVLNGKSDLEEDDKFDFKIFDTIDELENHTVNVIRNNPDATVAVTGLLSNDADKFTSRSNSKIFTNWGYLGETKWIPYIENKNYLNQYNGKLWVGTWWLPGLDVDYISVIIGGDAEMTQNGLVANPNGAKHYKMMISVAKEMKLPETLFITKQSFGKTVEDTVNSTKNILNYIKNDSKMEKEFLYKFSELLKNNYYILLTRGRKGCFVHFSKNNIL